MKIINFISGRDMGGPKQSFILYAKLFNAIGVECVNIVRNGSKIHDILKNEGLEVREVNYFRTLKEPFKSLSIKRIKSLFEPIDADVVFVHKQIDIALVREALGNRVKIVGVIHGFNANHIEGSDVLIAVSRSVKKFLVEKNYKKDIFILPNMIYNITKPKRKCFSHPVLIGSMGIFRRKKGFHTLLKSLQILKNRGIEFEAKIAGKGQLFLYLQFLKLKYGLRDKVSFVGWVENNKKEEFFDTIDILVLPSRTESFGMVIVEAMGRKKVVVSTNCEGPSEIIKHDINGFLVEKQNPEAMANMLQKVILQQIDIGKIQQNAYDDAISNYEITNLKEKLKDIIAVLSKI